MQLPNIPPNIATMGGCMYAGDLAIRKVRPQAILIIGDTREGKSTLYNYLMKVPIKGVDSDGDIIYQQQHQEQLAVTKNTFQSVTLIPNISNIYQNGSEMSLVDLPGFYDQSRSYVGIFGVSFMFQKILESVSKIKLIITIAHPNFDMGKLEDFIKPYIGFIRVLLVANLQSKLGEEEGKNFLSCISIVVSRARQSLKFYLGKIKKMIDFQQQSKSSDPKRRLIYEIMKQIYENKRIELLQQAKQNQCPPPCQILENLHKPEKNWKFYSFDGNIPRKELFYLPFKEEFISMKDEDKNLYSKYTISKAKQMQYSYTVLKDLVKRAIQSWNNLKDANYKHEFYTISQMIKDQPYGSLQNMLKQLDIDFLAKQHVGNTLKGVELMQKLREIVLLGKQIQQYTSDQTKVISQKIKCLYDPVFKIFDIFRGIFCQTRQREELFIVFMFMNMRYVYQSLMQQKVDQKQGSSIPYEIKKHLTDLLPNKKNICQVALQFCLQVPAKKGEQPQYQQLLKFIKQNISQLQDEQVKQKFYKSSLDLSLAKCQEQIKNANYKRAVKQLIEIHEDYKNYCNSISSENEEQIKYCKFRKNHIMKMVATCMEKLQKYRIVVKIYQHINAYYLLSRHYEFRIDQQKNKTKKYEIMREYSHLLNMQGKKERLQCLYERMIDQYQYLVEQRQWLQQEILKLMQNHQQDDVSQYKERLTKKINNKGLMQDAEDIDEQNQIWEGVIEAQEYFIHKQLKPEVAEEAQNVLTLFNKRNEQKQKAEGEVVDEEDQ